MKFVPVAGSCVYADGGASAAAYPGTQVNAGQIQVPVLFS